MKRWLRFALCLVIAVGSTQSPLLACGDNYPECREVWSAACRMYCDNCACLWGNPGWNCWSGGQITCGSFTDRNGNVGYCYSNTFGTNACEW